MKKYLVALVFAGLLSTSTLWAQTPATILKATPMRADKLPTAATLTQLAEGTPVKLLNLEGGWAWIEANHHTGWVRAGALNLMTRTTMPALASGRTAASNDALAMTVRALPPRTSRHALIISISHYAEPSMSSLPGAGIDRESATQIAQALQIPSDNITYLTDAEATGEHIRAAVRQLNSRVREGDRVFVYYSGHGTRYFDPHYGECTEALAAYDGVWKGTVTHQEMAQLLKPISVKADKLFVLYDSCFSGGMLRNIQEASRGFVNANDEGVLRSRFAEADSQCSVAKNVRTRGLASGISIPGANSNDYVLISASSFDEYSLEDDKKGGLATQFIRDCMLRDAKDLDGSGAITIGEIEACAQDKIDRRMHGSREYLPQHLTLSGNRDYIPLWSSPSSVKPIAEPTKPEVAPHHATAVLTGADALRQIYNQRDTKRHVQVNLSANKLRIGEADLAFSVQSDRPGYVYVVLAGSDNKTLDVLFPNRLDDQNQIVPNQQLMLPRPNWPIKANGPAGTDHLLIMVTDTQRDLSALHNNPADVFGWTLNDPSGRAHLGALITQTPAVAINSCPKQGGPESFACSDAYGAVLVDVEESR